MQKSRSLLWAIKHIWRSKPYCLVLSSGKEIILVMLPGYQTAHRHLTLLLMCEKTLLQQPPAHKQLRWTLSLLLCRESACPSVIAAGKDTYITSSLNSLKGYFTNVSISSHCIYFFFLICIISFYVHWSLPFSLIISISEIPAVAILPLWT